MALILIQWFEIRTLCEGNGSTRRSDWVIDSSAGGSYWLDRRKTKSRNCPRSCCCGCGCCWWCCWNCCTETGRKNYPETLPRPMTKRLCSRKERRNWIAAWSGTVRPVRWDRSSRSCSRWNPAPFAHLSWGSWVSAWPRRPSACAFPSPIAGFPCGSWRSDLPAHPIPAYFVAVAKINQQHS